MSERASVILRESFLTGHWKLYTRDDSGRLTWIATFRHLGAAERLCSGLYIGQLSEAIERARAAD